MERARKLSTYKIERGDMDEEKIKAMTSILFASPKQPHGTLSFNLIMC
jgi:hypothetical protein